MPLPFDAAFLRYAMLSSSLAFSFLLSSLISDIAFLSLMPFIRFFADAFMPFAAFFDAAAVSRYAPLLFSMITLLTPLRRALILLRYADTPDAADIAATLRHFLSYAACRYASITLATPLLMPLMPFSPPALRLFRLCRLISLLRFFFRADAQYRFCLLA